MEKSDIEVDTTQTVYSTECNWVQDIPIQPINDFEKEMLKGTKTAEELLEEEKKEAETPIEISEEEKQKQIKKDYINKIKVLSLDKLGLFPLANPSTFPLVLKEKVMKTMKETIDKYGSNEEELTKDFNQVCLDKLFNDSVDYSKFPIYK